MNVISRRQAMVFSDLDGSLLDHYSYSFDAALPAIAELARQSIPLVLCSSKTRAEMEQIRIAIGNNAPFIVENGAAIFIPQTWLEGAFSTYFAALDHETLQCADGYLIYATSDTRARWLAILDLLQDEYAGEFDHFSRMGVEGIVELTGLSKDDAALANQREFSEPVHWLGSSERRDAFITELESRGATVAQGGRFLGVTGSCDKGRALQWLVRATAACLDRESIDTLAIGDSGNDLPMLEIAHTALVIRSPVHDFPALSRDSSEGVMYSDKPGPDGWNEGVAAWLQERRS
ncbi:MAG: HAD-IIB family hydrolase [Halioglobus sp.]